MNGEEKIHLPVSDQSKFFTGDCYIYQYSYSGEDQEECLIGTWFGNQSTEVILLLLVFVISFGYVYHDFFLDQIIIVIYNLGCFIEIYID